MGSLLGNVVGPAAGGPLNSKCKVLTLPLFLILNLIVDSRKMGPHMEMYSSHEKASEVLLNKTICDHMCGSDFVSNC